MSQELHSEANSISNFENRPNNYLVGAILSTIFCCMPVGIVSIVFASQVNTKFDAGDFAGAEEASKKARLFMIIAIASILLVFVIYIAIFGLALMASTLDTL